MTDHSTYVILYLHCCIMLRLILAYRLSGVLPILPTVHEQYILPSLILILGLAGRTGTDF